MLTEPTDPVLAHWVDRVAQTPTVLKTLDNLAPTHRLFLDLAR